ncbi:MAG: hypothetical protein JXR70_13535 [Spirochaetales bacterium]|nr:hypothetical protein [Spirochaetales bacterium]
MSKKYSLFEVYGIELEYMIVDSHSLKVKSLADKLLAEVNGKYANNYVNASVEWSNELVNHVIELKTHVPVAEPFSMNSAFAENIRFINQLLTKDQAMLLSTAAHPTMDPFTETCLWEHDDREIYDLYNSIFDCRGHGWSNLQSTHINLPFKNDKEFGRLHAAVRLVLPLIPALCASSPVLDSKPTGFLDSRLEVYKHNQESIPEIAGLIIPEALFTHHDYIDGIFKPIKKAIKAFDKEALLDEHFLNSRGAIARFDRGSIEIRLVDIQECVKADLAIVALMVELIKALVSEGFASYEEQKKMSHVPLADILNRMIVSGENTVIDNRDYLKIFNIDKGDMTASCVWKYLFTGLKDSLPREVVPVIEDILDRGSLASRILKALDKNRSLTEIYQTMAGCLVKNELF